MHGFGKTEEDKKGVYFIEKKHGGGVQQLLNSQSIIIIFINLYLQLNNFNIQN